MPASQFRTAESLYQRADALRARGELEESCSLYRRSFDVYQSYLAMCGIARCLAEIDGKPIDAIVAYERARTLADSEVDVAFASARITALESKIAYLQVDTPPNTESPRIELWRDGKSHAVVRVREVHRLDPGEYEVRASISNGSTERVRVALSAGERKSLNLKFTLLLRGSARVAAGSVRPVEVPVDSARSFYRYAGATLAGVGLLATSYGIVRGTTVWSKRDAMQREGIDDDSFNALVRQARDARSDAILFIVGGSAITLVGISGMLYSWRGWPFHDVGLRRDSEAGKTRVGTFVTPAGIGLWGSF